MWVHTIAVEEERLLIGRTDCGGHFPFQIDCGEQPDTSAVGLSDVVKQQSAVRVQTKSH